MTICPCAECLNCLWQSSWSTWIQQFNSAMNSALVHRILYYLWGHKTYYQWRQSCFTGTGSLCLLSWRSVTKYYGASGHELLSKLTEHRWFLERCMCTKNAEIRMCSICLLSVWGGLKAGGIQWATVTLLRGKERYKDRWKEDPRRMGTLPLLGGSSDLSTGEWPKTGHEHHFHTHILCQFGSSNLRKHAFHPPTAETHKPERHINQITGHHTVIENILHQASVQKHWNVCCPTFTCDC